jgi:hypothetical protein
MAAPAPAGGAGAAAPAAAAPAAAAPAAVVQRSGILERIRSFISHYAGIFGAGLAEMFKPTEITLEDVTKLIGQGKIRYVPPPWVEDPTFRAAFMDDPTEYSNIIISGKRAMMAAFEVLRNFAIYRAIYSKDGISTAQLNNMLRSATVKLFESILLYHVYNYYKFSIRTPYIELATALGVPIEKIPEPSQYENRNTGVRVPHIEELRTLADNLNQQLISMNESIANEFGIESGGGVGKSARFPTLALGIDATESSNVEIAAAMEPFIRNAEDILDRRAKFWKSDRRNDYISAKHDFRKALHKLIVRDVKKDGTNLASRILAAVGDIPGSIMGAAEIGAATGRMAGMGSTGVTVSPARRGKNTNAALAELQRQKVLAAAERSTESRLAKGMAKRAAATGEATSAAAAVEEAGAAAAAAAVTGDLAKIREEVAAAASGSEVDRMPGEEDAHGELLASRPGSPYTGGAGAAAAADPNAAAAAAMLALAGAGAASGGGGGGGATNNLGGGARRTRRRRSTHRRVHKRPGARKTRVHRRRHATRKQKTHRKH